MRKHSLLWAIIIVMMSLFYIPAAYAVEFKADILPPGKFEWFAAGAGIVAGARTNKKIRDLQAKKATAVSEARKITAAAEAENRDLTDDDDKQFQALMDDAKKMNAQIQREENLLDEEAALANKPGARHIEVHDNREDDPKRGFRNFGEFVSAVMQGSIRNGSLDERLTIGAAAPSTFGNEAAGADGGFLIPPEYSRDIFTLSQTEDSLLPLTSNVNITGNSMVFPTDQTTPWGTDGTRAYWQQEASQATATKPKLGMAALRLHKLMGLVPLSDELIADTMALGNYLPEKIADSIRWKTNEALLFGTGEGQPLGCFNTANGSALVRAKDSGQATLTLSLSNISGMISQLIPNSFTRSIWLIGPDVLPALFGLTLGNYPIYLPTSAGAQMSPWGTLFGRPIIVSQHCAAFSSQGDVLLLDPKYIRTITKSGGIQTDTSIHLYFDADATAFRSIFRVDGQPIISQPITQAKGSNQLSPFIALAAR